MLTVFLDPSLNDPNQLSIIIEKLKSKKPNKVICFFNLHQVEFFKSHNIDVFSYGSQEWSLEDRNNTLDRIMQGFNDQFYKPYATVKVTIDHKVYDLNVFRFLSINSFLKNLFIPVAKTLSLHLKQDRLEKCLIIGDHAFKHHVTYCIQRLSESDCVEYIEINSPPKRRWLTTIRTDIKALVKLLITRFNSLFRGKHPIIIPTGQLTEPLIGNIELYKRFTIIHSVNDLVTLLKSFSSGQIEKIYFGINEKVEEVLSKEKVGHDDAIVLAFDVWLNYLQQGFLKNDVGDCIAMIRVLNLIKPKLVLQYNFTGPAYTFKMWCACHNVKTVCIQHGFQGKFEFYIKFDIESDVFLAWADLPIDMSRNKNVRVEVVGNPAYNMKKNLESSSINGKCRILITPTALTYIKADADWEFWNLIIKFLKANVDRFDVTLKFHHKDRFKELVTNKLKATLPSIRIKHDPISSLLVDADIIVSTVSTVVLDTFALNKPVIVLNNAKESEYFSKSGYCPVMYSVEELESEVYRLMHDDTYFNTRILKQQSMIRSFDGIEYSSRTTSILLEYLNRSI